MSRIQKFTTKCAAEHHQRDPKHRKGVWRSINKWFPRRERVLSAMLSYYSSSTQTQPINQMVIPPRIRTPPSTPSVKPSEVGMPTTEKTKPTASEVKPQAYRLRSFWSLNSILELYSVGSLPTGSPFKHLHGSVTSSIKSTQPRSHLTILEENGKRSH